MIKCREYQEWAHEACADISDATIGANRESYGDAAVGYVHLKRDADLCVVKCRICPELRVKAKNYSVILQYYKFDFIGGYKHAVAFLMWLHRRGEEPAPTKKIKTFPNRHITSNAYNRECDLYTASNVGRRITQYGVVEHFTKAYNRISNIEKATNGFQAAGILPLNPNKFDDQLLDVTSSPQLQSSNRNSQIERLRQLHWIIKYHLEKLLQYLTYHRKNHSSIITSSPMKNILEEKEEKKQVKEQNLEKTETKNKNKKGTTQEKEVPEESEKENEYYRLICGETYADPLTEDWIKCYKCSSWTHEKCTSGKSTSRGYICDLCEH
ncbi:hypothetical protein ILUMI_18352 [Ignelater luminosus]|uniref:Zinc finger PHD-type domain-containing protein n=1 Tax=Ignelater luminosus TaxID=2038154 RepID=A0A8K0CM96_IGNLU|nr:hypothetical protein ILUMI_18352 [Ignelater luminosus]